MNSQDKRIAVQSQGKPLFKPPFTIGEHKSQVWDADMKLVCNLPNGQQEGHWEFVLECLNRYDKWDALKQQMRNKRNDLIKNKKWIASRTLKEIYEIIVLLVGK